jgi:hypothetical protein
MKTMMMSKHYIYEIFGRKIGATNDVERRMKQQGAKEGEYRIIEEHTNAKTCSIRETELQKEFGYPVDNIQYWKTLRWQKKATSKKANKKRIQTTKILFKDNKFPQLAYSPEAQKKRIANTDYKAMIANRKINYLNNKMVQCNTPEAIAKRAKTNSKPINQSDLKDNFIKRWDSAIDAAREFFNNQNCQSNITACCKGKQKTYKNYKWNYAG